MSTSCADPAFKVETIVGAEAERPHHGAAGSMVVGIPDYLAMTDMEIEKHATAHAYEMGETHVAYGSVSGSTDVVIERREFGYAILQTYGTHLWLLYIDPECRGRRMGRRFVRELIKKYAQQWPMTAICDGSERRAFFGRCGFYVAKREGVYRHLSTDPDARYDFF